MSDPPVISVLLGLPTILFLVAVCAVFDRATKRRLSRWLGTEEPGE